MATIDLVLFDLDGTLADTARDLAFALNQTLLANHKSELPFEEIRPVVSHGGQALIELGFQLGPGHPDYETLRQQLLDIYQDNIAAYTVLFEGMEQVLENIEGRGMKWGVVTNKPGWLTEPLMQAMALTPRAATIISGDTIAEKKPHPAPLLLAASQAHCEAQNSIYVGDAQRDISAGKAAGMRTVAALFGYIGKNDNPADWGADIAIQHARELITVLDQWS